MSCFKRSATLAIAVITLALAGCAQQRTGKLVDLADQLNANSKGLVRVLKSVKDKASAEAAIPVLQEKYPIVFSMVRDIEERGAAANKAGGITKSGAKTLGERTATFMSVMQEINDETRRITKIRGLPAEFWNVIRVESCKGLSVLMEVGGNQIPYDASQYFKTVSSMVTEYGPDRVVLIEAPGTSADRLETIASEVQAKIGPSGKVAHIAAGGEASIMAGPVDDFGKFVDGIDFAIVTDKDPAQRAVYVSSEAPPRAADDSRPGAPARQAYTPPPSTDPAWEQPNVLANFQYDRMVNQHGKERMVRFMVTNFAENKDALNDLPNAIHKLASSFSTFDPNTATGYLGPVMNFDSFCTGLEFAEIVSRDDAENMLKIKVDPARLKAWVADAEAHPEKLEYIKLGLPNPSRPDYHKKLADLMLDLRRDVSTKAIEAMLQIDPQEVKDKAVRQQIARTFRDMATSSSNNQMVELGVRGVVRYGGKFSVPILVEVLNKENQPPQALFDGLAQFPDPLGAEALTKKLSNVRNRDRAIAALRQMGPVAEPPLMKLVPSENSEESSLVIMVLHDVGTSRSIGVLTKAAKNPNQKIVEAAKAAIKAIRERQRKPAEKSE